MSSPETAPRKRWSALSWIVGGAPALAFLPLLALPARSLLGGLLTVIGCVLLGAALLVGAGLLARGPRQGLPAFLVALGGSVLVLVVSWGAGARAERAALRWLLHTGEAVQAQAEREGACPPPDALPGADWVASSPSTATQRLWVGAVSYTARYDLERDRRRFVLSLPRGFDRWELLGGCGVEPKLRDGDTGQELTLEALRARLGAP